MSTLVRMLRLLSVLAVAAILTTAPDAHAQSQTKIAVVDTQRAIMETEDGLRAQATLKKLFDSSQRELDRAQAQLQQERDDIAKQRGVLSQEALGKRLEQWQKEMMELQAKYVEYNKQLQKKEGELTQPIYQKTMQLIRRVATQEGFDLVIDKQAVPYVRSDFDLTDRVITLYNQGGTAAPSAAPASDKKPAKPKKE